MRLRHVHVVRAVTSHVGPRTRVPHFGASFAIVPRAKSARRVVAFGLGAFGLGAELSYAKWFNGGPVGPGAFTNIVYYPESDRSRFTLGAQYNALAAGTELRPEEDEEQLVLGYRR